jgi:hypothetical protein
MLKRIGDGAIRSFGSREYRSFCLGKALIGSALEVKKYNITDLPCKTGISFGAFMPFPLGKG